MPDIIWVDGQPVDLDAIANPNTAPPNPTNPAPVTVTRNRRTRTATPVRNTTTTNRTRTATRTATRTPRRTTRRATATGTSGFQRARARTWVWTKTAANWLLLSIRLVVASICTLIFFYGVVNQNAVLSTFPAAGMLYFVPLEFSFLKRTRIGLTIFWLLTWAVIFSALRMR